MADNEQSGAQESADEVRSTTLLGGSVNTRRFAPYFIATLVALAIVVSQPLIVFGGDDFTVTPDGFKVFRYGFPFAVIDCAAHLPMHMTVGKVALRFIGNYAAYFFIGMLIVHAVRWFRPPKVQR